MRRSKKRGFSFFLPRLLLLRKQIVLCAERTYANLAASQRLLLERFVRVLFFLQIYLWFAEVKLTFCRHLPLSRRCPLIRVSTYLVAATAESRSLWTCVHRLIPNPFLLPPILLSLLEEELLILHRWFK